MAVPTLNSRPLSGAARFLASRSPAWKCAPCRNVRPAAIALPRRFATTTTSSPKKPYYVTTPIFYVNAAPHIGHLYTMIIADVLKRWQLLLGENDAQLLTGTDEHGMKIQQAAFAKGIDAQAFCDRNYKTFEVLAKAVNLSNDHFVRTTSPEHRAAVEYFWDMLNHRGYIYTAKHEGWYSVSDEAFYSQSQVHMALDPSTGRKRMVAIETGKEVEWSSETNYHFRLSAFQERLLDLYRRESPWMVPSHYATDIVKSVSSGLQDLSISRPVERLTWGVRVPGDETQTIYVWLDALVNYLTKTGYPFPPGHGWERGWPADVHVVGKDITRFHCVYWPAFLMALDLPLPNNILVHGHWTMNREKMSKSTGNVVNPFFAIDRFGVDTMRFFLAYRGSLAGDADYDNEYIVRDYKKLFQGGIGNLTLRTIGIAKGNLRSYIIDGASGEVPPATAGDVEYESYLREIPQSVATEMKNLNPRNALHSIMSIVERGHKYFHNSEPWKNPVESRRVIYNVCESVRIAAILLQPFMPTKAPELLDLLCVDPLKRGFSDAVYQADAGYGEGVQRRIIFPKLISEH